MDAAFGYKMLAQAQQVSVGAAVIDQEGCTIKSAGTILAGDSPKDNVG